MKKALLSILYALLAMSLYGQVLFNNVAAQVGINLSYEGTSIGGGVSFCDFNGDGLDDLSLATGPGENIHFYINNGNGFTHIPPLVPHMQEAKQILWVDFDNDGDKDLFVAGYGCPNRLYKNNGNLELEDITEAAGLPINDHNTFGACFGDIDRDGWLDLYFCERIPFMNAMSQQYLFKNNADGTFSDITEISQTADAGKASFCSSFFDYNNDKWPDIYTANDRQTTPNTLLENNADGTFSDASQAANADLYMDAMCVNVGDYNNDGWSDIYVTNTPTNGSALLHNTGPATNGQVVFGNAAQFAGVGFIGGIGWGSVFFDADNDSDLDLYVSGAIAGAGAVSAAFYLNNGNGTFSEPYAGFAGDTVISYNNAVGDFNNDGFTDIIVLNRSPYTASLWQNTGGSFNWIKIKLQGVLSNRDAIGTKIETYSGDNYQMYYTHCGNSFLGQNSLTQTIGLKDNNMADSVIITWPTGHIDRLFDIESGQNILVIEGSTTNGEIYVDSDVVLNVVTNLTAGNKAPENMFQLYPCPATDILNIESTNAGLTQYSIIDKNGQTIKTIKYTASQMAIKIGNLPAGIYFIIATDKHGDKWAGKWTKI